MSERREAARRLCLELDRLGVRPVPDGPTMTVTGVMDGRTQTVALRPFDARGLMWCFVWPGVESTVDPVLPAGEEPALARRLHAVLSLPELADSEL